MDYVFQNEYRIYFFLKLFGLISSRRKTFIMQFFFRQL
jgi:hypothetical protein